MPKSTLPTNPTAAQVRTALGLPSGVPGRLNPADIARYNKGKRAEKRYVVGATTAANKARTENRAALVAQGLAGKRGPVRKSSTTLSKD